MERGLRSLRYSLRLRIIIILLAVFVFNIGELITLSFLMKSQRSELQSLNRTVVEMNQQRFSDTFSSINRELAYLISNEPDFIRLPLYAADEGNGQRILESAKAAAGVNNRLSNLSTIYGSHYYFWYYDASSRIYIDTTYENANKLAYRQYVLDRVNNAGGQKNVSGRFTVGDSRYLELFIQRGTIWTGAAISINDFYKIISHNNADSEFMYTIFNKEGEAVESRVYGGDGFSGEYRVSDFLQQDIISMAGCDFSVGVAITNKTLKTARVVNFVLLALQVLLVVVIVTVLFYTLRGILLPLQRFTGMLKQLSENNPADRKLPVHELSAAGDVMNRMVLQIHELESAVYEEQLRKQKVQLDYAQIKIRPHFFINCLNVIHSMAQTEKTEEIQDLCLYVSGYLRSLYSCPDETYTLAEELALIDNYLSIVKEVNGQRFTLNSQIDGQARQLLIPPLLVETFVENSLKYARSRLVRIDILVTAKAREDGLYLLDIRIEDTGGGFGEEVLNSLNEGSFERKDERHQIGIINIVERLSLMYGDKGRVSFYNTENGAGVSIQIDGVSEKKEGAE